MFNCQKQNKNQDAIRLQLIKSFCVKRILVVQENWTNSSSAELHGLDQKELLKGGLYY